MPHSEFKYNSLKCLNSHAVRTNLRNDGLSSAFPAMVSEPRYPNESREYREARDQLLKDEQELIAKVKAVAARRRTLPPGGTLKEDYTFQWASEGKIGQEVNFSELFGDKDTALALLLHVRPELGQALSHLHIVRRHSVAPRR